MEKIVLLVEGQAGYAERHGTYTGFTGKFASFTGYHCASYDTDEVETVANTLYAKQARGCFLVGATDCEGWRELEQDHRSTRVRIRIPNWTGEVLRDALGDIGVTEDCPLNNYWLFPESVTPEQAREILKPLLAPKTRFVDEGILAKELTSAYQASGFLFEQRQGQLFQ